MLFSLLLQVNPPYYMPLVELIPSPWTSAEVISRTKALMTSINQVPVLLKKEVVGFVQPRIQYVIIQECLNLWKVHFTSTNWQQPLLTMTTKIKVPHLKKRYEMMYQKF